MKINLELFVDSVSNMKQDERFNINDFPISDEIQVNSAWCKNHIESRYPTGDLNSFAEATKYARPSSLLNLISPQYVPVAYSGDINMGYVLMKPVHPKLPCFGKMFF